MSWQSVNWNNNSNQTLKVHYLPKTQAKEDAEKAVAVDESAVKEAVNSANKHYDYRVFPSPVKDVFVGRHEKNIVGFFTPADGVTRQVENVLKHDTKEGQEASIKAVLRKIFDHFPR